MEEGKRGKGDGERAMDGWMMGDGRPGESRGKKRERVVSGW
jgi:hypothetical protein